MKKILVYGAAIVLPMGMAMAAGNPPEVKEGLWSIRTQTTDNPGGVKSDHTATICRNHAYDQYAMALVNGVKGCTTSGGNYAGNEYSIEMKCTVGTTVIDSKGTTTFDGDTSTHSETHATYTPAMAGISDMTLIQDQKYIGACPTGMQPGDETQANGTVLHLWKH